MKIVQVFRRPREGQFSIERVFQTLDVELEKTWEIEKVICPLPTSGAKSILRNLWFFFRYPGEVFHLTGDVFYLGCILPKKKFLLTIHDLGILKTTHGLKNRLFSWFWFAIPIFRSGRVVAVSDATRSDLLERFPWAARKTEVIPNAIDPVFTPINERPVGSKLSVLMVGTRPHKNIDSAVHALKGLDCEVWLVGEVSPALRAALDECGLSCLHFENLTLDELVSLYQRAAILLFPSFHEGFGLPILEAQACGAAVITSNLSPMKEVAGEGALLVDPHSVAEIREALKVLLSDPQKRMTLVEKGFGNASRYRVETVARAYSHAFHRLMPNDPKNES
jgi:glycosyltransferase involved in cell wall biosynthesis